MNQHDSGMCRVLLVAGLITLYLIASTIEFNEMEDKYNYCIEQGSQSVYTDSDVENLERKCSKHWR